MAKNKAKKKNEVPTAGPPTITPPTKAPVSQQEYDKLKKDHEKTVKALKKAKDPKGIKSANPTVRGELPRTDEILESHLDDAETKETSELTPENKMAIEREIRRYVKKGGMTKDKPPVKIPSGLRKGITKAEIERCDYLLRLIGRVDKDDNPIYKWDETIMIPGFVPPGLAKI